MHALVGLLAGIATWPALEYALHRVLAHTVKFPNKFKTEHLKHHRSADYFAGAGDKLAAAVPSALVLFAAAWTLSGTAGAAAFTAGFLASYLLYERTHKRFHTHPPRTRLGLALRKHHLLHHCVDAKGNHGVTTRLFDRLFGTFVTSEIVALPRALAPGWVLDGEGRIAAAYRRDFALLA